MSRYRFEEDESGELFIYDLLKKEYFNFEGALNLLNEYDAQIDSLGFIVQENVRLRNRLEELENNND